MNTYGYGLRIKGTKYMLGIQTLPMVSSTDEDNLTIEYTLHHIYDWEFPMFLVSSHEAAQRVADYNVISERSSYTNPKHSFSPEQLEVVLVSLSTLDPIQKND